MTPKPGKVAIPKPKKVNWKKLHWDTFSLWIRRDGICLFHAKIQEKGLDSPCVCNGVLQACHKLPRKNSGLFYDERNVFCGCSGSNAWSHFNEKAWDSLWEKMWPEDIDYLRLREGIKAKYNSWFHKTEIDRLKKLLQEYKGSHF